MIWVITVVLVVGALLVYRAARRAGILLRASDRLAHQGTVLTEQERHLRALTESALAPRPEWAVRILVEGRTLPAIACYRVPAGWARDPKEAVRYVRRRHPHAAQSYPDARWLAFPVVDEKLQQEMRRIVEPA